MKLHAPLCVGLALGALACAPSPSLGRTAQHAEPGIETLTVLGQADRRQGIVLADAMRAAAPDATEALAAIPGVAVNRNGPLTSILQYRGLYGTRMGVRVDGQTMIQGGPNWMDPPFHYAPRGLLHEVSLTPGVTRLGDGTGLGGGAQAAWKRPDYSEGGWQPWLDVDSSASSVDEGWGTAASAGLASERQRLYGAFSREEGGNFESGDGTVVPSAYTRTAEAVGYGLRTDRHSLDAAFRRIRSDDAGTPVLPMDIEYFDTELWHVDGRTRLEFGSGAPLELRLFLAGSNVRHAMNNFEQRTAMRTRRTVAFADGLEARFEFSRELLAGTASGGLGWHEETHDARIGDPSAPAFFVSNFDGIEHVAHSAWLQWNGAIADGWQLESGVRLTRTRTDADDVDAAPARMVDAMPGAFPMGTPPRAFFMLRERFNASDRSQIDHNLDLDLILSRDLADDLRVELALARRTRTPAYMERYLWIPLEANAGLGDGNTYVGDPLLDPEVSHQLEFALLGDSERSAWSLRAHVRQVDDYVTGLPATDPVTIALSTNAAGDPTPLDMANVDARFWGIEADYARTLTDSVALELRGSWLEGEIEDLDDHVFRLAPPEFAVGLRWARGPLTLRATQRFVARELGASRLLTLRPGRMPNNRFERVDGYALTQLDASWRVREGLRIDVGVENLLDADYEDATSGFVRAPNGEVPVGARLPGRGRNLFARLRYQLL
jgi:iron complex outermembrane receptor protein